MKTDDVLSNLFDGQIQRVCNILEIVLSFCSDLIYFQRCLDLLRGKPPPTPISAIYAYTLPFNFHLSSILFIVEQARILSHLSCEYCVFFDLLLSIPEPLVDLVSLEIQFLS